jgi:hypothetical protein
MTNLPMLTPSGTEPPESSARTGVPVRPPSLRYQLVKALAGVAAFFSVPILLTLVGSFVAPATFTRTVDGGPLAMVGAFVELALAIPVYRAVKRRRRGGLMALLFAQAGVIIQKGVAAFASGAWTGVLLSLVWFAILLSIRDELDQ